MEKIGIIVCGSNGRMGRSITLLLNDYSRLVFIGGVDSSYSDDEVTSLAFSAMEDLESRRISAGKFLTLKEALHLTAKIKNKVVIDFTSKSASLIHAEEAMLYNTPIVIGSTGFSDEDANIIKGYGRHIPVVLSGNMSLGINVLLNIVYDASKYLGEGYDCEIVETHHRKKKDAPSGTAKMLAESVAKQRNIDLNERGVYGRCGDVGERDISGQNGSGDTPYNRRNKKENNRGFRKQRCGHYRNRRNRRRHRKPSIFGGYQAV